MQFSPPPDVDALSTRLPPLTHHDDDKMLPSISTVTGVYPLCRDPIRDGLNFAPHPSQQQWPPLAGPLAYRQPPPISAHRSNSPATMDLDGTNSVASVPSPGPLSPRNSVTLDDPDVRLAAEALGDLRADFISSPPDSSSLASPKVNGHQRAPSSSSQSRSPHPEPLLSLLTTAHPFVASTIGGASSAYGGAKNFSPRFKCGAEYVEGYLTPLAKTVNSVGRVTGVEGGVRWFLGNRRQNNSSDANGHCKKRRKVGEEDEGANKKTKDTANADAGMSPPTPRSDRRSSSASTVDTLPAYDEMRSPAYSETAPKFQETPRSSAPNGSWPSRLIMSTSGLSVAMSAESLRSLKYCLKWLRWTNDHMSQVIGTLKSTLEEYERTAEAHQESADQTEPQQTGPGSSGKQGQVGTHAAEQARSELTAKINILKVDVLKTLQETINTVSKYAGGGLPENARILVRRHLTSLPQRFRMASMTDGASTGGDRDSDCSVREGAQKVLVLAREGLEMVTQITGVLDGTIVSAEQWCERMGKRRRPAHDGDQPESPAAAAAFNDDVKMAA
ncbi:uncharacterized protein UV8b_06772 [Ustilaginoidea virens]|uniref:Clock controlled protein n=1 Tax=Ustilaginoidea virens TaxID=1159556 RepID=A0A8E5MJY2_USTVR|nr:uncharacterized protein UV8b_06772 [Ustilaginoidea virens]QUC22531.1 hypothetical protein UV8b_06772 [Ustilaginoidea virens]